MNDHPHPLDKQQGVSASRPRRLAFYGGSFDPVHRGHLSIASALVDQFSLDEFVFIPAFHAPHKLRKTPTSAYDRYAMLCLATQQAARICVSKIEIDAPEHPFSVETLTRLNDAFPSDRIFFVMGADSWMDITTWREWEKVLSLSDHIVVTRPDIDLGWSHVTPDIQRRIVDLRGVASQTAKTGDDRALYITDAVSLDISATGIRQKIRENDASWNKDLSPEVANYIEKYQIYN